VLISEYGTYAEVPLLSLINHNYGTCPRHLCYLVSLLMHRQSSIILYLQQSENL